MKSDAYTMTLKVFTLIIGLSVAAAAWAENPAEVGQNPQTGAISDLTVKVLEVEGRVQFRENADADFQKLTADSKLTIGSEIRTGLRSMTRLQVGPNSVVTLEGLGKIAIAELAHDEDADVLHTRLAKKYGRMIAEVHQVGETRNDYKIATPGSVLAVRGSGIIHVGYDNEHYQGLHGSIFVQHNSGQTGFYTEGDQGNNQNPNPTNYSSNQTNRTRTSTPGTDQHNQQPANPNTGYHGFAGGQNLNQQRGMMMMDNPRNMGGGGNPGEGGNP